MNNMRIGLVVKCEVSVLKKIILLLLANGIFSSVYAQDLILSAPPRETAEAGIKLYGPVADHLSQLLGVRVTYVHPANWLKYQREMRNDKYDIIFDGPHFISWRIVHLGHEALVKLPGNLQFNLVALKNNHQINQPEDLIGKKICGISPPNLSSLWILGYYHNPVRQPMIAGIKGGMGKVFQTLSKNTVCEAAILRTAFQYKILKQEQQDTLKIILSSKAMPNQGFSVSKRLSADQKSKIKKSLTMGEGVAATKGILQRYAGNAQSTVKVADGEYAGYNNLLEGVIFGW